MADKEIKFEIKKEYGVLSEKSGYQRKVTRVSWNDKDPKIDIRDWKDGVPKKGITLTDEEAQALVDKLTEILEEE